MRRLSWTVIVALGLLVACGGKTDGGGADGGSGAGGSGAGGSGAGGSGGGVASGGTGGASSKIAQLCQKISQTPCPLPSCVAELNQSVAMASSYGCGAEFDKVLDCALAYPLSCEDSEPQLAPQCAPVLDAFVECVQGPEPECSASGGSDGSCSLSCSAPSGGWGVKCWPTPTGLTCSCVAGPSPGVTFGFTGTCQSPGWSDTMEAYCGF